jgi:hypothetical protein
MAKTSAVIESKSTITEHSICFSLPCIVTQDLHFIQSFLRKGIRSTSLFLRTVTLSPAAAQVTVHIDWAGSPHSMGGVCLDTGEWFHHTPSPELISAGCSSGFPSSPVFEAAVLPIALYTFEKTVTGKVILVCSDNESFVKAFHNMKSSSPLLEEITKLITLCELSLKCRIVLQYIPRDENISDPITHNQIDAFRTKAGLKNCFPRALPNASRLPPPPSCLSGQSSS